MLFCESWSPALLYLPMRSTCGSIPIFSKTPAKYKTFSIYLLKYEPFKQKIANSEKGKDNFLISFSSAKLNLLLY